MALFDSIGHKLQPNVTVRGSIFPEPVQILLITPMGNSLKVVGRGIRTNQVYDPILSADQVASLQISPLQESFDGDAQRFRLAIEAMRLGMAYEYDPYFSLSIARIDPLPHQLEAVYDRFLRLPRIRFLLADDPGAGKTIMAGLLIKELKIRGLIQRILIVAPAKLTFQWQREMADKFHERFDVIRGDVLRSDYGSNPWQERNQAITSISWVSRIDDARDSLMRSHWDLIVVDEAHKMSAYSEDRKTLAYQLGEALSERTDHYLLMTATPHKGDPDNFCLFLQLLDQDVYGDVRSLQDAVQRNEAPFYLRRVKEALVTFPDPDTGEVKTLFTERNVQTVSFQLDPDEWDLYLALTEFVEDQSIRAAQDDSARGRAVGFTMAMLQRRLASSVHAVRRSLERMRDRRQRILDDPDAYRREQILRRLPDDFDDLEDSEQEQILIELEEIVISPDPRALREEILELGLLIRRALDLEQREVGSKLHKLRETLNMQGVFDDPTTKLLIFTEHKETLDYLVATLREWGLSVTQIHGGMKIGHRDQPGTRIHAEREFRDSCQVMVATEAAGEGINLQFCWLMINYDIPWNPVRLEQRMGRIHRYGQERDCLILNFVATNTREGRVLHKLFERIRQIEADLDPQRTGKVFNVLGDVFPSNQLERMVRDMYAHNLTEEAITARIVEQVDTDRFQRITASALEGLAKRELNLASIVGKAAEAKARRLVPEVIEDFFLEAAALTGMTLRPARREAHVYRLGRVPRGLWPYGDRLESRFGRLGRQYDLIAFDKDALQRNPTLEWVTPGHSLFECVREYAQDAGQEDLDHGAVFYDLHRGEPTRVDVYSAAIRDGRGQIVERRLFLVECGLGGEMQVRQPTLFHELTPAPKGTAVPDAGGLPGREQTEAALIEDALQPLLQTAREAREREVAIVTRHLEISLSELINRQNIRFAELHQGRQASHDPALFAANVALVEGRLDELHARLERRRLELQREAQCTIADIQLHGRAWILPHPDRDEPDVAPMVRNDEIERIAVDAVIAYEAERGRVCQSVEQENRGFDLIARKPHPEDAQTAIEVRFIEVKGRSGVGEVALSSNEYKTAQRMGQDYWLYVVYNCASTPEVHVVQDPCRLAWKPVVQIQHYYTGSSQILQAPPQA